MKYFHTWRDLAAIASDDKGWVTLLFSVIVVGIRVFIFILIFGYIFTLTWPDHALYYLVFLDISIRYKGDKR